MKSLLLAVVLVAGCTKPNPAACSDGNCTDPSKPFCDVDGTIGGTPDTCIAVSCTAGQFKECRDDRAVTCNAAGNNFDLVACENGCGDIGCKDPPPPPPCTTLDCMKHIIPKYLPSVCDSLASVTSASLDITVNTEFDTGGTGCMSIVPQSGGPDICVMHFGTITIEPGKTYRAYGTRAIALVADADFAIKGIVDVSADVLNLAGTVVTLGPAANFRTSGTTPTTAGGGGAGNRTDGASGGSKTADGDGADAGTAQTHPAAIPQLLPGTYPLNTDDNRATAGGAATLVSCRGKVSVLAQGVIDAGGDGGSPGSTRVDLGRYVQATGGGSGGNVVLQGMQIAIDGAMYSNGGAGGGGDGPAPGARGPRSTSAAVGGSGTNNATGGYGGALNTAPTVGKKGSLNGGGGGGGSTGFFLTYTPSGVGVVVGTSAVFSPLLEANNTVPTN